MKILEYPKDQKQLRVPGVKVTPGMVQSAEFQEKLERMKIVLKEQGDGIGLAATQVGWSVSLFLLNVDETLDPCETKVYLNPKVVNKEKASIKEIEACLSFPDLREVKISRPLSIDWEYDTLSGEHISVKSQDYYARAIMHEVDHLEGRLFIDLASRVEYLKVDKWLKTRN